MTTKTQLNLIQGGLLFILTLTAMALFSVMGCNGKKEEPAPLPVGERFQLVYSQTIDERSFSTLKLRILKDTETGQTYLVTTNTANSGALSVTPLWDGKIPPPPKKGPLTGDARN